MATMMVIGAGPGIGFETARRFAREGFDIILASRNPEKLTDQIDELRALGANVTSEPVDAVHGEQVTDLVTRHAGELDVLFYNAAALKYGPTIEDVAPHEFDEDVQIGIASAMRAIKAVLPAMVRKGTGTILLTGGGLADEPDPLAITLGAAKAALRVTGQALFAPLKEQGIHIATITVGVSVKPGSQHALSIADLYWRIHTSAVEAWEYEHPFGAKSATGW